MRNLLLFALLSSACGSRPTAAPVLVFGAASCTDVLTAQGEQYGREKVRFSFASSALLARQIEQGAPAGICVTANHEWMTYLVEKGRVAVENQRRLIGNRLVLIGPRTTTTVSLTPGGFFPEGRLALADPDSVPAGIYAKQSLTWLGLWPKLQQRVIPTADVRAALNLVRLREAELGIVYASDLRGLDDVHVLATFPAESHEPIEYYIGLVGKPDPASEAFYRYLQGEKAKQLFLSYGFEP